MTQESPDYELLCWLVAEADRHEQLYAHHRGEQMAEAFHSLNATMCREAAERIDALNTERESLKAKLLSDEMVAIISLALATHAEETTANIFGKPIDTATFKSACQSISYMYESSAKAALEAAVGQL